MKRFGTAAPQPSMIEIRFKVSGGITTNMNPNCMLYEITKLDNCGGVHIRCLIGDEYVGVIISTSPFSS